MKFYEEITCTDALHATNPCPTYPWSIAPTVGSGRDIIGTDGSVGVHVGSNPWISYGGQNYYGPSSSNLSSSLRRNNATPRYTFALYNRRGTQIGSTLLGIGSLAAMRDKVASDITLGSLVRLRVINDINQAYDPDVNFSANRMMRWGA